MRTSTRTIISILGRPQKFYYGIQANELEGSTGCLACISQVDDLRPRLYMQDNISGHTSKEDSQCSDLFDPLLREKSIVTSLCIFETSISRSEWWGMSFKLHRGVVCGVFTIELSISQWRRISAFDIVIWLMHILFLIFAMKALILGIFLSQNSICCIVFTYEAMTDAAGN